MLSSNFLLVVNAESVDTSKHQILTYSWMNTDLGTAYGYGSKYVGLSDGTTDQYQTVSYVDFNTKLLFASGFQITNTDGSILIPGGKTAELKLDQLWSEVTLKKPSGDLQTTFKHSDNSTAYASLEYVDGTTEIIYPVPVKRQDSTIDVTFNFTPKKDLLKMSVILETNLSILQGRLHADQKEDGNYRTLAYLDFGEKQDGTMNLSIEVDSKEAGLLASLIEWVKGIFDKITDGFENVKNGFTNVINGIIELPQKIWSFIEDGLKKLFVPDESFIESFKNRWDLLLEDKLGAVYQVVTLASDLWNTIMAYDETNIISMPEVEIPLPDDIHFAFGGYDVKIVPDGFVSLVNAVKLIISILATVLFVNGLRKRYDEVMGVEQ